MTVELRVVEGEHDLREFARVHAAAFGHRFEKERLASLILPALARVSCVAAYDSGRMVAVSVDEPFEITLPGGRFAPARGVTWVGVLPTERGRGLLRALLEHQHADFRRQKIALSLLYASQTTIYGRFGYGPATMRVSEAELDTRHGAFARPFQDSGSIEMVDHRPPLPIVREVLDRSRADITGELSRSDAAIAEAFADAGPEPFRVAHRDAGGGYDGFAAYTIEPDWLYEAIPRGRTSISMLLSANPQAHAAIWRYLIDLDLTRTVTVRNRPLDDPIRLLLAEWRHYHVKHVSDGLWVNLLDPAAALEQRGYARDGRLVFDLEGERLLLEVEGARARCTGSDRPAEIEIDRATLSSAYLGGTRFSTLRDGLALRELSPGACARADGMFATSRDPWCSYEF